MYHSEYIIVSISVASISVASVSVVSISVVSGKTHEKGEKS